MAAVMTSRTLHGREMSVNGIRAYCRHLQAATLVIGIITKGNTELTLQRWQPTFETYLSRSLQPYGCATRLVPLHFHTYEALVANRSIDFIFPNPTAFQEMKAKYGVQAFLSVKRNFAGNQELDRFGGVIVRAAKRHTDVSSLADLRSRTGLRVCAVNPSAFGGWQIQWYEMLQHGVNVTGSHSVVFLGGHEAAIRATVVSQTCDIGIARTETVERMVTNSEFDADDVYVIGEQGPALGFPQHISTALYPEWPLASLAHVPRELEQLVAVPLLTLTPTSPEAVQGDFAGAHAGEGRALRAKRVAPRAHRRCFDCV